MGRKKRDYVVKHKQSLGDVIENPETYGVRVRAAEGACVLWPPMHMHMRRCRQCAATADNVAAEPPPPVPGCERHCVTEDRPLPSPSLPRRRSRGPASGEGRRGRMRQRLPRRRKRALCPPP
jgi:hypothetical protein